MWVLPAIPETIVFQKSLGWKQNMPIDPSRHHKKNNKIAFETTCKADRLILVSITGFAGLTPVF